MSRPGLTVPAAVELIERHEQAIERLRTWIAEQQDGHGYVLPHLTPRERTIALGLLAGISNVQLVEIAGVSPGGPSKLRGLVYFKLGARRRADAVALLRLGGLH
jgi:DNA-binding CsgD family transcriptional regulator